VNSGAGSEGTRGGEKEKERERKARVGWSSVHFRMRKKKRKSANGEIVWLVWRHEGKGGGRGEKRKRGKSGGPRRRFSSQWTCVEGGGGGGRRGGGGGADIGKAWTLWRRRFEGERKRGRRWGPGWKPSSFYLLLK